MTTIDYRNPQVRPGREGGLDLAKVSRLAGIVGAAALVLALIVGMVGGWASFFHAYLMSYMLWFGISIGSVALMMLYQLVGGRWGDVLRPLFETGAKGLPLMAVLFLPLLFGLAYNYPWADAEQRAGSHIVKHQYDVWMRPGLFVLRAIIYFAIWFGLAWLMTRGGRALDLRERVDGSDVGQRRGLMKFSGPGILLYAVTVTLASVDWAMSVEPGWFSHVYGLLLVAGQGLSTVAFMTAAMMLLSHAVPTEAREELEAEKEEHGHDLAATGIVASRPDTLADREVHGPHSGGDGSHKVATADPHHETHPTGGGSHHHAHPAISPTDWGDMGNLLLLFTMLWAYLNLSQFLIIWSGNLPMETVFYHHRVKTSWRWVGVALVVFHFALPFFCLLMRDVKRHGYRLGILAVWILVMRQVDFFWQINPSFKDNRHGFHLSLADLLVPVAMGGIFIAYFAWQFRGRRVLPQPGEGGHHHG